MSSIATEAAMTTGQKKPGYLPEGSDMTTTMNVVGGSSRSHDRRQSASVNVTGWAANDTAHDGRSSKVNSDRADHQPTEIDAPTSECGPGVRRRNEVSEGPSAPGDLSTVQLDGADGVADAEMERLPEQLLKVAGRPELFGQSVDEGRRQ